MINRSGYGQAGASHSKNAFKGFDGRSLSPEIDIDFNNKTLRQRARILFMSSSWATSIIKTYRTNTIGTGLILKSSIKGELIGLTPEQTERLQKQIEREFYLWANDKRSCDATGVNDFNDMQQLAFMSYLTSGDLFAVKKKRTPDARRPYLTCWQLIEADRVATPTKNQTTASFSNTHGKAKNNNDIFDGVEVDKNGLIQAYYICNQYPTSPVDGLALEWERVEAYGKQTGLPNVLHVMSAERPGQYRGVSILAQGIEPILQSRRYTEAEVTAAVVEASLTGFVKTEAPTNENPLHEPGADGIKTSTPDDYELGPGQINILKPGEDIVFSDPKRPAGGFPAFMDYIAQLVGAGAELPRDLLTKNFNTSYSASRAAFLEAQKAFKMQRRWFAADFNQPIFEAFLTEAVALGRLDLPGFFEDEATRAVYCGAEWIGPAMSQIDPTKEIAAMKEAVAAGFKTRTQAAIELNGSDFMKNAAELTKENKALAEAQKTKGV